jgi:hypothetical protein
MIRSALLDAYLVGLRGVLPLGMRALPLPTLFRLVAPRRQSWSERRARQAIAHSEAIAPRLRLPDTCLYRAMVRFVALRAAGLDVRFRMGVRRDRPESGHAWVELGGMPVGEPPDARLVATFNFP